MKLSDLKAHEVYAFGPYGQPVRVVDASRLWRVSLSGDRHFRPTGAKRYTRAFDTTTGVLVVTNYSYSNRDKTTEELRGVGLLDLPSDAREAAEIVRDIDEGLPRALNLTVVNQAKITAPWDEYARTREADQAKTRQESREREELAQARRAQWKSLAGRLSALGVTGAVSSGTFADGPEAAQIALGDLAALLDLAEKGARTND